MYVVSQLRIIQPNRHVDHVRKGKATPDETVTTPEIYRCMGGAVGAMRPSGACEIIVLHQQMTPFSLPPTTSRAGLLHTLITDDSRAVANARQDHRIGRAK